MVGVQSTGYVLFFCFLHAMAQLWSAVGSKSSLVRIREMIIVYQVAVDSFLRTLTNVYCNREK